MKKLLIIIITIFLLQGCSSNPGNSGTTTQTAGTEAPGTETTAETAATTTGTSQTSVPVKSPDGKKTAYLAPFEWEVLSDIHIYDTGNGKDETVVDQSILRSNKNVREQTTPKKLVWLDDRFLLVVIQFAYGTVAQGGDLYVYDTVERSLRPLTKLSVREQIADAVVEKDFVFLDFVEFTDDSMNQFQKHKKAVKLEDIYETIRSTELISNFYMATDLQGIKDVERALDKYVFDGGKPFDRQTADLNGDGKSETIEFQVSGEYGEAFILKVNGLETRRYGDNLDEKVHVVDIDKNDGLKEIAIQEYGPSDDPVTYFYAYTDAGLLYMGKVGSLAAEGGRIDGSGRVKAVIRPSMLQTWFCEKEFRLNDGHLLESIAAEMYPALYQMQPLKLKTGLKLLEEPKGKPAAELAAGDEIRLLGSDGIEWCYGQTPSGARGWFAVDGFTIRENGREVSEVFDGLSFAD